MSNLKLALRALSRTPGTSIVVMLSLGLGVGSNTAIFSLLHQALLRTLPVSRPHELAIVTSPGSARSGMKAVGISGGDDAVFSYPMMRALERDPRGLEALAGFRTFGANLAIDGKTTSGGACLVSGGFFSLLGVLPAAGRLIEPVDDRGAGEPVAVLSHEFWQSRLGGRRDVLNRPIRINGQQYTIVGVAARGFQGPTLGETPEVFVPMTFKAAITPGWDMREAWDAYWVYLLGRRKPELEPVRAEAMLNAAYAGLLEEQVKIAEQKRPEEYRKRLLATRLKLSDGSLGASSLRGNLKVPLMVLMICAVLVLLIAAANAANLMLARAAQRQREMAIRAALGAGRWAIMKQVLLEAMVLSAGGAILGVILGAWTLDGLIILLGSVDDAGRSLSARLDPLMMGFSLAIAVTAGVLFGLYPSWVAARGGASPALKDASWGTSAGTGGVRVRRLLVGAQVALSMTLLIPMGLFLKTLVHLIQTDIGVKTEGLVTFQVSPELNGYKLQQSRLLFSRLETALEAMPGVQGATAALIPILGGDLWGSGVDAEGYSSDNRSDRQAFVNAVSPGYFRTMGVPLVAGREFVESDAGPGASSAVVNEAFARHFFGDRNPVGRTFSERIRDGKRLYQIVGVVRDSKYAELREKPRRVYYMPYQKADEAGGLTYYVRSGLPPETTFKQIREIVRQLDPDLPVDRLRTMDEQVQANAGAEKVVLQLSAAFALLATLLAMLGLYGVVSNSVTRRTREIGIRLALGAQTSRIGAMVLSEVGWIAALGMAAGVPLALALARYTESQLFGVQWLDAGVLAAAALGLAMATGAAAYLPARRATRTDPVQALRYE